MRVSTTMLYDLGVGNINQQYSDLLKLQNQLSTGKRVLTPSDDPIASARALGVTHAQAVNSQYITNGQAATGALQFQESVLSQFTDLLHNVRTLAVNAGDGSMTDSDLKSVATEVQGLYDQLMGLANSTDSEGLYLFSGYKGKVQPFTTSSTGAVVYNGDQGQRLMQISASRQIAVSSSGADVFQRIKDGNGTFVTAANASNTGTGIVGAGTVQDAAAWDSATNNKDFTIVFNVDSSVTPSVTTYDIIDNVSGNSVLTGAAPGAAPYPRVYTSGSTINLSSQGAEPAFDYGASLVINGDPATGDSFTVQSSRSDQDIFSTLNDLIDALKNPGVNGASGNTALINKLNTALSNIDLAQDNLLSIRANVGASLNEVDAQRNTADDLGLQYSTTLSNLQDLDYAKALSDLAQKQANLEAAQQSFLKVQGLSLFNFLQ